MASSSKTAIVGKKDEKSKDGMRPSSSMPSGLDIHRRSRTVVDIMETIRRMRGVFAVMTMNTDGLLGKTNYDKSASGMFCGLSTQILNKTIPLIQKLSPRNQLRTIRSNGGGQELIISPVENHNLVFVVVQNCRDHESIASNFIKEPKKKHQRKKETLAPLALPTLPDTRSSISIGKVTPAYDPRASSISISKSIAPI